MVILLSIITLHACFKLNRKKEANHFFFALIILTIIILILEICSVLLNSKDYINLIIMQKLINTLGFTLAPLIPVIAIFYTYKRINGYKKIPLNIFFLLSIPFIFNLILSLSSYYFNWIFSVSAEGLYLRGPLFIISPLTSFFYYTVHLLFLYTNRRVLGKEEIITLASLTFFPALLSVFQLYYFIYLTIWNSVGIAVIINYIFIMHDQANHDPLTGLGNRTIYEKYLTNYAPKNKINLSVIMMDLDEFKKINDIYGHQEGDKVLQFFAQQLETVFQEAGLPIRLGGDEFIVLLKERSKPKLEQYIKVLNNNINQYNKITGAPYQLQYSYGIAIFDNSFTNIYEFIHHSDKLMYEAKQKKKQLILEKI